MADGRYALRQRLGEAMAGHRERDVGEGLREVAEMPAGSRIGLLGEQPDVVLELEQPLVHGGRLVETALLDIGRDEPERAGQERTFAGVQAVGDLLGAVA